MNPYQPLRKISGNRLTAMLRLQHEPGRYLEQLLEELSEFVDDIVILNDGGTDSAVRLCQSFAKVSRLEPPGRGVPEREPERSRALWELAVSTGPDWLLQVRPDEFYEEAAKREMRRLINQDVYDWVGFRIYDFWGGSTHYRDDDHWNRHTRHTRTLVRYLPDYHYFFPGESAGQGNDGRDLNGSLSEKACGGPDSLRLPLSYAALPGFLAELRIKHYGWALPPEALRRKAERWLRFAPGGDGGSAGDGGAGGGSAGGVNIGGGKAADGNAGYGNTGGVNIGDGGAGSGKAGYGSAGAGSADGVSGQEHTNSLLDPHPRLSVWRERNGTQDRR
ncbi:hypothetical protein [Paenibacillus sp. NFR01]|uniref:hypothetical protein n=1 Tax=Paenibacillus sp. NFR01 TaxID=1566279 RepID=UPI0008CB5C25|nr:hypothetical protein [Paenibacillus sp. NFR01]SEU20235.1 hypothetical protein SAMN03159358_3964 [Paenibacillus sp. NFR01]